MFITRSEVAILETALDNAVSQGVGSTIFLAGEPGIGKSTLVEHFLNGCDTRYDVNILTGIGRCIDIDGISRGYLPWKEVLIELDADRAAGKDIDKKNSFKNILKTLFDETGSDWIQNIPQIGDISAAIIDTAQAIQQSEQLAEVATPGSEVSFRDRLRYIVKECTGSWLGAIPFVGGLAEAVYTTSVKLAEKRHDVYMQNQEDFFGLVMTRLRSLAKDSPVVVFLDDLQWADASSLGLLLYLAKNLSDRPYPLLLIGSYRPDDVQRGRYNAQSGEMELHPLEEKLNILRRYAACGEIDLRRFSREQVAEYIAARFPRNDFNQGFFDEVAHATNGNSLFVQEMLSNMVERKVLVERDGRWRISRKLDYSSLPRTIEGVIKERYERLADDLQELLQVAAVEGEEFSFDVVGSILDENTLKLHRKLDSLINRYHMVSKSAKIFERLTKIYEFTHNLVQKYIYYSIQEDFRRDLHRMIAGSLQSILGADGIRTLAVQYSFHLGVGHGIIDEQRRILPDAIDAAGSERAILNEYAMLQQEIAERHIRAYHNREAIITCGDVIELARLMDDPVTEIEFTLKRGRIQKLIGNWKEAESGYRKALSRAEETGNRKCTADAQMELGWHLLLQGDFATAMVHFEHAMRLYENLDDKSGMSRCASNVGAVYRNMGDFANAMNCYQRSIALAEEIGNRQGVAITVANMGNVYADQGDYPNAMDCFKRYLELCEELGDKRGIATALGLIGAVYADQGDYDNAVPYYQKRLQISEELGDRHSIARVVGNMGIIYEMQGDLPNAMQSFRKRLEIAEELGDRSGIAIALGNMGNVYKTEGDFANATACYDRALEEHRSIGYTIGIVMWLLGKAEVTWRELRGSPLDTLPDDEGHMQRLQQAKEWTEECLALSEQINRLDRKFKGLVLLANIEFSLGEIERATERLREMIDGTAGADQAELHYELGKMKIDCGVRDEGEGLLGQALAMYETLHDKSPRIEYRQKIEEIRRVRGSWSVVSSQ